MRVAAFQYDVAWRDRTANWATIERLAGSANLRPGDFALLPELSDTGFTMDPPPVEGPDPLEAAARVARSRGLWMQVGHATRDASGNRLFNVASIVRPDGSVAGAYR